MKFTEAQLEAAIIHLLGDVGYPHVLGAAIVRQPDDVLIKDDLRGFLSTRYAADNITPGEIETVIRRLEAYSAADLYESNKAIMKMVADGFLLKREDRNQIDLYVQLIDYGVLSGNRTSQLLRPKVLATSATTEPSLAAESSAAYATNHNLFKLVNQLEILGSEKRIPDGILYINGLPLVVFEFKSAISEDATIHDAWKQLTNRYRRDIPELFKYNAFCVISDGVNNKAGSLFAPYEFFYSWRKTDGGDLVEVDGINSLHSLIQGMFQPTRLLDVIRNFIYLPDTSRREEKVLCRYPQYYAATKLYQNILQHMRIEANGDGVNQTGDGKGGTYFGATGCGKSYTMLFLTRLLMKSVTLASPTIVVITDRTIAYAFYKEVIALRPEWAEVKVCADGEQLTEQEKKEITPIERVKLVMTRGQDDEETLYKLLGTKEYRKELDRQFKNGKSNFKIAIVVDMWLTGFDVPFLDSMYIDKPVKKHSLIQTISRVNRKYEQKQKGLVVDYIGIKKQMNLALAHYSQGDQGNFEDVAASILVVKDHLDLLKAIFHKFNSKPYFSGQPIEQLHCLNMAAEFVQVTEAMEQRFMNLTKRMKAAYDICVGSDGFTQNERDHVHFYLAIRSIVFKLTKGDAPDIAQMNAKVQQMLADALASDGVEEIFKMGQGDTTQFDLFDPNYLAKIDKIKLPNTKIKLLQQLLAKAIDSLKKVNKLKGVDFSKQFTALVEKYNDRSEHDVLQSTVLEDFTDEIIDLYHAIRKERESFSELGIDFEEKAFYDILKALTIKYDFAYPEDKLLDLAKKVKVIVDDKAKYTDWSQRSDIKAELKVDLIILLADHGYPPIDRDEVYKDIFEQAENFKKYQG